MLDVVQRLRLRAKLTTSCTTNQMARTGPNPGEKSGLVSISRIDFGPTTPVAVGSAYCAPTSVNLTGVDRELIAQDSSPTTTSRSSAASYGSPPSASSS